MGGVGSGIKGHRTERPPSQPRERATYHCHCGAKICRQSITCIPCSYKANEFQWNDELVKVLMGCRAAGWSYSECAEHIGVSAHEIGRMCQKLQINRKGNKGRVAAPRLMPIPYPAND